MSLLLEPRHVWKQRAVELGVTVAFGGALPPGRRLVVRLSDGKVRGDADESARWRGRVLIRETPADLSVAARAEVHAVAQRMAPPVGDFELEIVWDGEVATLVGARLSESAWEIFAGIQLSAVITVQRAYQGRMTEVVVGPGVACMVVPRQEVVPRAGGRARCRRPPGHGHRPCRHARGSADAVARAPRDAAPVRAAHRSGAVTRSAAGDRCWSHHGTGSRSPVRCGASAGSHRSRAVDDGPRLARSAWHDGVLARLAAALHQRQFELDDLTLGGLGTRPETVAPLSVDDEGITVAVFGAHLQGQPLNG